MERSLRIDGVRQTIAGLNIRLKEWAVQVTRILAFSPADARVASEDCLCVSIEKGGMSVVHASKILSHGRIKSSLKYDLPEGHEDRYPRPDWVASTAAAAVRQMNAADVPLVLSVPKQWVVMKTVDLPLAAAENLPKVVSYELDRFTPFSADEALYDFAVLKKTKEKISLLVAAVKESAVREYSEALKEVTGLTVVGISFDLAGTAAAMRYIAETDSFAFLEVDNRGMRGGNVVNGILARANAYPFDALEDDLRADAVEAALADLTAQGEGPGSMKILLAFADGMSRVGNIVRSRGTYAANLIDGTGGKIRGIADFRAIPAHTVGVALEYLRPDASGLNLLHRGVVPKQRIPLFLTIILALAIAALVGSYLFLPVRIEELRLKEIDRQIALRKPEALKVEEMRKEMELLNKEAAFVDSFRNSKPLYMNMIKELTVILPDTVWLTRLRIAEGALNIEGYAPSANMLIPKLEASKYFRKVEFASPTFRDARQNMDRFQIKMEMKEVNNEKKQHS